MYSIHYTPYSFESGSVSELVAKWLSTTGIDPARLIDTTDVEFDQLQLSVDSLQLTDTLSEATAVEVPRQERTKLLSLSVEIGDEAKVNTTTEACVLGKTYFRKTMLLHYMYFVIIVTFLFLPQIIWPYSNATFHIV